MLRFITAGESHGYGLVVIIDGVPAGLRIKEEDIDLELNRRQKGFGRGKRMAIERDHARIIAGVRFGETISSPVALLIENRDWLNWTKVMSSREEDCREVKLETAPRPGHADLAGIMKYGRKDIRDILERASARETAARVAAGTVFKKILSIIGIKVVSFVEQIGPEKIRGMKLDYSKAAVISETSPLRCPDKHAEQRMVRVIQDAAVNGDTIGGKFTVAALNVPPGLGSHAQWDKRLDGSIARAVMSIPAVKGVEFGAGFAMAAMPGSKVHDEIYYSDTKKYYRKTNNAGGVEGGITNGEHIVIHAVMKPIPSLVRPLVSVDVKSKKKVFAAKVRSDVCAVPAASVVGEAMLACALAQEICEKFGGDTVKEIIANFSSYKKSVERL
ncbi:MAG: chorismate synthase [Elusimicrobiota bacterium]